MRASKTKASRRREKERRARRGRRRLPTGGWGARTTYGTPRPPRAGEALANVVPLSTRGRGVPRNLILPRGVSRNSWCPPSRCSRNSAGPATVFPKLGRPAISVPETRITPLEVFPKRKHHPRALRRAADEALASLGPRGGAGARAKWFPAIKGERALRRHPATAPSPRRTRCAQVALYGLARNAPAYASLSRPSGP